MRKSPTRGSSCLPCFLRSLQVPMVCGVPISPPVGHMRARCHSHVPICPSGGLFAGFGGAERADFPARRAYAYTFHGACTYMLVRRTFRRVSKCWILHFPRPSGIYVHLPRRLHLYACGVVFSRGSAARNVPISPPVGDMRARCHSHVPICPCGGLFAGFGGAERADFPARRAYACKEAPASTHVPVGCIIAESCSWRAPIICVCQRNERTSINAPICSSGMFIWRQVQHALLRLERNQVGSDDARPLDFTSFSSFSITGNFDNLPIHYSFPNNSALFLQASFQLPIVFSQIS